MTTGTTAQGKKPRRRPPWWAAAAAVLVTLVVLGVVWGVTRDDDGADDGGGAEAAGSSTAVATPTDLPTTDGFGSPIVKPKPGQTKPRLAKPTSTSKSPRPVRVGLDEPADLGNGVVVEVTRVESVQGNAKGRGERDAPAVRLTIELTNDTDQVIDLRGATVTAYFGPGNDPASDLSGPGADFLPSEVRPDATVTGVYVFAMPTKQRGSVRVDVGYAADQPQAIFRGSAA
jgi:hypothetical protein